METQIDTPLMLASYVNDPKGKDQQRWHKSEYENHSNLVYELYNQTSQTINIFVKTLLIVAKLTVFPILRIIGGLLSSKNCAVHPFCINFITSIHTLHFYRTCSPFSRKNF